MKKNPDFPENHPTASPVEALPIPLAAMLFLAALLLLLFVGAPMQNASFGWGLLATELICILLPAVWLLRLRGIRILPGLSVTDPDTRRLKLPSPGAAILILLLGCGLWLVGSFLEAVLTQILPVSAGSPPDAFPTTTGRLLLIALGMVVAAPICEEALFRGVIQRSNAIHGKWAGILVSAGLFALFHLSFQRALSIIPVALGLAWLFWRTGSLIPGILLHAVNNLAGMVLLMVSTRNPGLILPIHAIIGFAAGLLIILTTIPLLKWLIPAPVEEPRPEPLPGSPIRRWMPVIVNFIAILVMIVTLQAGTRPGVLAKGNPLKLEAKPLGAPVELHYTVHNRLDAHVGNMICKLQPVESATQLDCARHVDAYETTTLTGYYASDTQDCHLTAVWDAEMHLVSASQTCKSDKSTGEWTAERAGEEIQLRYVDPEMDRTLIIPADGMLPQEAPFRLMALPFSLGEALGSTLGWANRWQPELNAMGPLVEDVVVFVQTAQPLRHWVVWRVMIGKSLVGYYDTNAPHTLLQYEDDVFIYKLVDE
mgnify:FL=1